MKATKKILGASAALVMAVGVATGSTFAWFTSNNTVKVDQIEMGVVSQTDNLLVLATDTANTTYANNAFKTQLTNDDILNALGVTETMTMDKLIALDALTSGAGYAGGISTNGTVLKNSKGGTESYNKDQEGNKFAEYKLVFRSTVPSLNILLYGGATDDNLSVVTPQGDDVANNVAYAWDNSITEANYGAAVGEGAAIIARAANAARVAFISGENGKVWAPNETLTNGGQTTTAESAGNGKGFWKGNLASDYNKHMGVTTTDVTAVTNTGVVTPLTVAAPTSYDSTTMSDNLVVTLGATKVGGTEYYQAEVTVRIWLEGTDGDCFDAILSDSLNVQMSFIGLVAA